MPTRKKTRTRARTNDPATTTMTEHPLPLPQLQIDVQYAQPFEALTKKELQALAEATVRRVTQDYQLDCQMIELTVRFCTAQQSRQLNAEYRQQDKPTNVLTFTYGIHPQNNCLTADILLCVPVLQDEAHAQQKSIPDHIAHLWVHGILHALGFDHIKEDEAQEMETLEIEILKDFHIQNPYA